MIETSGWLWWLLLATFLSTVAALSFAVDGEWAWAAGAALVAGLNGRNAWKRWSG